MSTNFTSGILS